MPKVGTKQKYDDRLLQSYLIEKYRKKMSKKLPEGFSESLEELPWETIIALTSDYKGKIKSRSTELKNVQRKLSFALLVIKEHLGSHKSGRLGFDVKFVKSLLKLLSKTYKLSIQYEVDLEEFMLLLTIIIEKMKKEKLTTYNKRISSKRAKIFEKIDTKLDYSKPEDDDE
jgi:hypothetical protein